MADPAADRPLRSDFDAVLEVAGEYYDIARASGDFALSQIPRAVCLLAVGRDAETGTKPANIHSKFEQFAQSGNIAKIWFCPRGEWSVDHDWPEGPHLIFEGRIVGIGLQKTERSFQLVVYIEHWLGDLNFSSCMSEQSHPANISDYTFNATVGPSKLAEGKPLYAIKATAEGAAISPSGVKKDLWGEVLKPLFCSISEAKSVQFASKLKNCVELSKQDNTQSLGALSRIEGVCSLLSQFAKYDRELSCYTPELALRSDNTREIPPAVVSGITSYISQQAVNSFEQSTIWGKLIGEYAAQFQFCVVPLVDTALVVPVIPGLRSYWCKRITACDYTSMSYQAEIIRPLRAVALFSGITFNSGAQHNASTGSIGGLTGCGGCWSPDPDNIHNGMVLVQTLPGWLNNLVASSISSARTTGANGNFRSSTLLPHETPEPDATGRADGATDELVIMNASAICNGFAHAKYVSEVLRGRNATVTGKLRFDIAPGSTVWVEGTTERHMSKKNDQLAQNLVGLVLRVSFGLDSETGKAGTAFTLGYVRTEKENELDSNSVECHPLYATRFLGAPLVDTLWFAEEGDGCCTPGNRDSRLDCV